MKVPFIHKKNLGQQVWVDVPEPLPPTYRYPFPANVNLNKPYVSMNGVPIKIATFELNSMIVMPNSNPIPVYIFKEFDT